MRTELHRVRNDCFRLFLNTEGNREETLELVVPDRCGDIGRILDVRGQLFLTSKKLKDGEAVVCSRAELCILFAAEGSEEIEYVSAQLPIEQSFAAQNVPEGSELFAQVRLSGLEARALNPRKLLLRAESTAAVRVFSPDTFCPPDGFNEDEGESMHIRRQELSHSLVTDLREKSFTISDEYTLPTKFEGAKLLSAETRLNVYDTKSVGGKVVFKANADTMALFLNPEDDSIFTCDFTTQFSQIIEVDAGEGAQTLIFSSLKEAEFVSLPERETPCISVRLNMCAQALCVRECCCSYVSDAYSCCYDTKLETSELPYSRIHSAQKLRIPLKGRLPNTQGAVTYLAPASVSCRAEEDRVICTAELSGIGEGEECSLLPVKLTLSAEEKPELCEGGGIEVLGFSYEPVSTDEGTVSMTVTAELLLRESGRAGVVSAVSFDETCPCSNQERPALTVLLSPGSADTWTLAKKYRSTEELIVSANACGDDFDVCHRPLIIPRA